MADYTPQAGYEEKWHVIGDVKKPVWMGRKKDIAGLFTQNFWFCVKVWQMFNAGFGLPGGVSWDDLDPDVAQTLLEFEQCFKYNFSQEALGIKYQEIQIKQYRRH